MNVACIIPARYASTRLPGKPLLDIAGKPMIQHVVERVRQARRASRIIVATDDVRIFAAVEAFGGEVSLAKMCLFRPTARRDPQGPSGTLF